MKTLKMSDNYFDNESNTPIGGYYFEASMDNLKFFNTQINIENPELLTETIKNDIKENLKTFIESIQEYGWGEFVNE